MIKFVDRKPEKRFIYLGVKKEHNAESLDFEIKSVGGVLNDIITSQMGSVYIKLKNEHIIDTVPVPFTEDGSSILFSLPLDEKYTTCNKLFLQIEMQGLNVKWETQVIEASLSDTLDMEEVVSLYPRVLQDLEDRVSILESTTTEVECKLPEMPEGMEKGWLYQENGVRGWGEISIGGGGQSPNIYFSNTDSDIADYKELSYKLDIGESEITKTMQNGDKLMATFLYPLASGETLIDAGVWKMEMFCSVSSIEDTTRFLIVPFLRHDNGTEIDLFTALSPAIKHTGWRYIVAEYSSRAIEISETDRLGFRVYMKTNRKSPTTLSCKIGDGYASYVQLPLKLSHDQLRRKDGEDNFLHINKSQKDKLIRTHEFYEYEIKSNNSNEYYIWRVKSRSELLGDNKTISNILESVLSLAFKKDETVWTATIINDTLNKMSQITEAYRAVDAEVYGQNQAVLFRITMNCRENSILFYVHEEMYKNFFVIGASRIDESIHWRLEKYPAAEVTDDDILSIFENDNEEIEEEDISDYFENNQNKVLRFGNLKQFYISLLKIIKGNEENGGVTMEHIYKELRGEDLTFETEDGMGMAIGDFEVDINAGDIIFVELYTGGWPSVSSMVVPKGRYPGEWISIIASNFDEMVFAIFFVENTISCMSLTLQGEPVEDLSEVIQRIDISVLKF